jgi:small subunit ribosomal protein S20
VANHQSAIKEHRKSLHRRDRNRQERSRMRTAVKKLRKALEQGDASAAKELLPGTLSLIDRAAKHGAIHGGTADRYKSRLSLAINRATAG